MRGNAWQVTAIIAIILVVVLIVPLVIMGRNHQTLSEQTRQAKKDQTDAAQRATTLEGENRTLKSLIGVPDAAALDELRNQYAEMMEKALPGENDTTRTYHDTLAALIEDLGREKEGHRTTSNDLAQTQSDLNNERSKYEAAVAKLTKEKEDLEAERRKQETQFSEAKQQYDKQLKDAQAQQNITLSQSERVRNELNDQVQQLAHANQDIRETNTNLSGMLEDIRNPNVEHPAGKVIAVDQLAGSAIVNLGSADGLLVRTMFSVYHSGITGMSFRTAPVGQDVVYCDVCRRDIARDVSKAGVEVMRILGPHRAEVRILDDILTDPIMVGDVVYSPIWKPGQKIRFALTAGMHLPGSSTESGTEAIIRLIEMNGGIVDCWIDENANIADGDEHLKGRDGKEPRIDDLTNFIVVSRETARILEPEVARVQQELLESAKNRAVKTISLEDLLSRMGWRNVTPVYTFGSQELTPETRVLPPNQGALFQSRGVVTPMFTPDNADSRLNARDAHPGRSSSGIVSPLFDDNAPPPPASSGKTSDLFRPRAPQ